CRDDAAHAIVRDRDASDRRIGPRLPAVLGEIADKGIGEAARAPRRAWPTGEMSEEEEIQAGNRAARLPRRHIGVHRGAVEPCRDISRKAPLPRQCFRTQENEAAELERAVDVEGGEQAQPARNRWETA